MAIQTVVATVNGQQYTLTYNASTGKYEATRAHLPGVRTSTSMA